MRGVMGLFLRSFLTALFLGIPVAAQQQGETGIVRLRVDIDAVRLSLDGNRIETDSYDNPLGKDTWFILNVTRGEHIFKFEADDFTLIEKQIIAEAGQVTTLDIFFVEPVRADTILTAEFPAEKVHISVFSIPESVSVRIDDISDGRITPFEMEIVAGVHTFTATLNGHEPLEYEYDFSGNANLRMSFLMASEKPSNLTAEELGMEYKQTRALREEKEAEKTKEKFNNLAESFIIIPTGQGVLARLVMGKDGSNEADFLISLGAGMTITAYLAGKILSSRQLKSIRTENAIIEQENFIAKDHNRILKKTVDEKNNEALDSWFSENEGKGIVEIVVE